MTETPCVLPPVCPWRSNVVDVSPHVPPRNAIYLVPPSADDISLQGAPYACPFATGNLEPDASALFSGVSLVLYQVNLPVATLRLGKTGTTIVFAF